MDGLQVDLIIHTMGQKFAATRAFPGKSA